MSDEQDAPQESTVGSQEEASALQAIQEVISEVPDEILVDALVERIDKNPSTEIKQIIAEAHFSGPIPPPSMLAGYDEALPGSAERIIAMAESRQSHRQDMERIAIKASIGIDKRGQVFALIVSLAIILGSMSLIALGHEISGSVLAGTSLTGLAYIFITGREKKTDEESEPTDEDDD